MPKPGTYTLRELSKSEYSNLVKAAIEAGNYVSNIGYPQNADIIERLTGYRVEVTRNPTDIAPGDELLIMRLAYRTDGYKGRRVRLEDFEFYHCQYR